MNRTLKYTGAALFSVLPAALAWGLIEPHTLDVRSYAVPLPHLPLQWDGKQIAVMGDLQIGMWLGNTSTVAKAVAHVVDNKPAAVLLLGDFINAGSGSVDEKVAKMVRLLQPLTAAGISTFAVEGNHDYSLALPDEEKREGAASAVAQALEGIGVHVLDNEARPLANKDGGEPLYIVGIGSRFAEDDAPGAAERGVPQDAARVVMMHNPDSFAGLPPHTAPLAVAGHTHGGQISIPFTPHWSVISLYKDKEAHADGWIEDSYGEPGNRLYVNRGLGLSIVPIRLLTPPELTYFALEQADGESLPKPREISRHWPAGRGQG